MLELTGLNLTRKPGRFPGSGFPPSWLAPSLCTDLLPLHVEVRDALTQLGASWPDMGVGGDSRGGRPGFSDWQIITPPFLSGFLAH